MVDPGNYDSASNAEPEGNPGSHQGEGINSGAIVKGCVIAILIALLLCCSCCGANYYFGR